jgi:hypothetical protein
MFQEFRTSFDPCKAFTNIIVTELYYCKSTDVRACCSHKLIEDQTTHQKINIRIEQLVVITKLKVEEEFHTIHNTHTNQAVISIMGSQLY